MKKILFVLTFIVALSITNVTAQNCNQGEKLAEKTWEKWGTWKPNISLIPFNNTLKRVKKAWNWIASNGGATIGPRFLELDGGNKQGSISGQTKRTFVTPPSFEDTITITVNKYDGRAETGLVICSHGRDGVSRQLKSYTFENSKNGKVKTFTLNNVRGKIISVAMRNRSVGNKFKYRINAE